MSDETPATPVDQSTSSAAPTAAEEENVFLLYIDDARNPGPGEFVMHGPNLFFRRGKLTGPVTSTVAGLVTGRKKPPLIVIASAEYLKEFSPELAGAGASESGDTSADTSADNSDDKKADSGASTTSSPDTKNDDTSGNGVGTGTTAPGDPNPDTQPATERKPKSGTRLTTG
jgi:hypothetical protein